MYVNIIVLLRMPFGVYMYSKLYYIVRGTKLTRESVKFVPTKIMIISKPLHSVGGMPLPL